MRISAAIAAGTALSLLTVNASAGGDESVVREMLDRLNSIGDTLMENAVVVRRPVSGDYQDAFLAQLDPGAVLCDAERVAEIELSRRGEVYCGAGIEIGVRDGFPVVSSVLEIGPAGELDISEGDRISAIDGEDTDGMGLSEVLDMLRPEEGATLKLTLAPDTDDEDAAPRELEMVCSRVKMPVVDRAEQWPDKICYMRINGFFEGRDGGAAVHESMEEWSGECDGMIMDLRGAGGPDFAAVPEVASGFTDQPARLFSLVNGKDEVLDEFEVQKTESLRCPVVVLVDDGTRGACECLAAVLKMFDGVLLLGEQTRGDAGSRGFVPLGQDLSAYIATATVRLAGDSQYDGVGVKPDVEVSGEEAAAVVSMRNRDEQVGVFAELSTPEEEKEVRNFDEYTGGDVALRRALDVLVALKALNIGVNSVEEK